ncbi:ergothioneine biosynthesis protein EgtB [Flavobacteriaceae bacterium F08102]|nr:ergothioneine biosynthesis protein EgtB [Flavobacteriaceae bacterium F08102]
MISETTPPDFLQKFIETRAYSVTLCEPLNAEDYIPQPRDFASPPKWHLAHTTWFFEEMILSKYVADYIVFHPKFSFLFNSYYQTIGDRAVRAERGAITRPNVDEVYAYRDYVNEHMCRLLTAKPSQAVLALVELGIHHEQQHQELLLTDLKHTFSLNPIFPVYRTDFNLVDTVNQTDGWLRIEEGLYEIGYEGDGFCFDNELGKHTVFLPSFEISKSLVTNGAFIEFMEDGGYETFSYWLDKGWTWVREQQISRPLYWYKIEGKWYHYTLAGLVPVKMDAILSHISFYEAHAFATWKGMRLPTEFEWEAAASKMNWGQRWEWTYSAYLPYPGFKIDDGAVGEYNGKFMLDQLVLRGSSVATPAGHERITYRNFFPANTRWQFNGIRLVK